MEKNNDYDYFYFEMIDSSEHQMGNGGERERGR